MNFCQALVDVISIGYLLLTFFESLHEQQFGIHFRIKAIFYFLVAGFDALPPLYVEWDYLQGTLKVAHYATKS